MSSCINYDSQKKDVPLLQECNKCGEKHIKVTEIFLLVNK